MSEDESKTRFAEEIADMFRARTDPYKAMHDECMYRILTGIDRKIDAMSRMAALTTAKGDDVESQVKDLATQTCRAVGIGSPDDTHSQRVARMCGWIRAAHTQLQQTMAELQGAFGVAKRLGYTAPDVDQTWQPHAAAKEIAHMLEVGKATRNIDEEIVDG